MASRIEGLAQAGTTWVSEETFKRAEGFFRFEALGQKKIKGKQESVKVYQVIAPSTRRTRFDVSGSGIDCIQMSLESKKDRIMKR